MIISFSPCTGCDFGLFQCDNDHCMPIEWVCDSTDDCGDGSDEKPEACAGNVPGLYKFL